MKWEKIGQIFEFQNSPFTKRFIGFAQSPQAVVFDDYIRIYFSTRIIDKNNKFLSIPQFVDFDPVFKRIINYSKSEIIKLGALGTFDEHGIFPFSPYRFNDKVYAYRTGWTRRISVIVDSGIGLSISTNNGNNFVNFNDGPVLTSSLYEPYLVCDGFVRRFNEIFHMWYIYGITWQMYTDNGEPERTYVIGHAKSYDGINWVKDDRQIIEQNYLEECQALPTVINIDGRYHMYFCHRHSFDFKNNSKNSYRLGYAYSDDLINWKREDWNSGITTTENTWDSDMMCYPNLFEMNGEIYLLYNGNEFGKSGFGLAKLKMN